MVPVELLEQALAQIAALTAELAAVRAAAEVERAELQAKLDALMAKLDELLAKKGKKAPPVEPALPLPPPPELDGRPRPPEAPEWSGRPGRFPSPAPHRSGRAGFPHPALRITVSLSRASSAPGHVETGIGPGRA